MTSKIQMMSFIFENPAANPRPDGERDGPRSRREHRKSRNGCSSCKDRRIKCDEAHPACSRCREDERRCSYLDTVQPNDASTRVGFEDEARMDDAIIKAKVFDILTRESIPPESVPDPYSPSYRRVDALELIDHFMAPSPNPWIGSSLSQSIMQTHALALALNATYLLHTILAFSATHLSTIHRKDPKYCSAAVLHYNISLTQYLDRLSREPLHPAEGDALFAAAVLHTMLAFVQESRRTKRSGFDRNRFCSAWLRSFQGTQVLLERPELQKALRDGIWADLIPTLSLDSPGAEATEENTFCYSPVIVAQLNSLKALAAASEHADAYMGPADRLRTLAPSFDKQRNVTHFISFISHLPPAFNTLLEAGEPEALLILGFWCAMLTQEKAWWTVEAAHSETERICEALKAVGGEEKFDWQVRFLMQFSEYHLKG